MTRRHFLQTLAVTGAGSFLYCNPFQSKKPAKPNIIYIMADDLGYGDLSCYGQEKIKTPNIDRLAQQGIRFTDCYAGATVCAPSRSVLMTGQHTGHTRVRGNFARKGGTVGLKNGRPTRRLNLFEEDTTVADVVRSAGYRTCLVGKWHIGGYNPDAGPLDRGFDEFYGSLTLTSDQHKPAYWPPVWVHNRDRVEVPQNQNGQKGYYRTDMNTDLAIQFIEKQQDQPFFLYLAYSNPHSPYDAPDLGPYADKDWPMEEKTYAAMIHNLDQCVGRVMQTLEDQNLDEKTIVFFCSDNGPRSEGTEIQTRVVEFFDSNGPLQGYKRDMTEGGIRVPMIVRWPGQIPAGKTGSLPWYFADVLPTAAALAGAAPPDNIDGIDVTPWLDNPDNTEPERYLYWEFFERGFQQAVRWKQWKAIRLAPDQDLQLYDLSTDLGEVNDIAGQHPDIVQQIENALTTARTDSPHWPVEPDRPSGES